MINCLAMDIKQAVSNSGNFLIEPGYDFRMNIDRRQMPEAAVIFSTILMHKTAEHYICQFANLTSSICTYIQHTDTKFSVKFVLL